MADLSSRPCGLDFVVGFTDGIRRAEELAVKIDFIMTAAVMDGEHRHHSFLLYLCTVNCRAETWTCCAIQVRTPTAGRIRIGYSCAVKSMLRGYHRRFVLSSGVAKDCFLVRKICAVLRNGRAGREAKLRNPKSPK